MTEPAALLNTAANSEPLSPTGAAKVYVVDVAPEIGAHVAPSARISHWIIGVGDPTPPPRTTRSTRVTVSGPGCVMITGAVAPEALGAGITGVLGAGITAAHGAGVTVRVVTCDVTLPGRVLEHRLEPITALASRPPERIGV